METRIDITSKGLQCKNGETGSEEKVMQTVIGLWFVGCLCPG